MTRLHAVTSARTAHLFVLIKGEGMIDWKYPFLWGVDLKSYHKSIWLGWWLISWSVAGADILGVTMISDLSISFQPSL